MSQRLVLRLIISAFLLVALVSPAAARSLTPAASEPSGLLNLIGRVWSEIARLALPASVPEAPAEPESPPRETPDLGGEMDPNG